MLLARDFGSTLLIKFTLNPNFPLILLLFASEFYSISWDYKLRAFCFRIDIIGDLDLPDFVPEFKDFTWL